MNASVTATGMSITAKNESGSLVIGAQTYNTSTHEPLAVPDLTSVQAANLTTVDLSAAIYNYTSSFAVKPSAHNSTAVNISSLNSYGNWFYKNAALPSDYAAAPSAPSIALTSFTDYVITYDLYITVAQGSPAMANLKCNASITATVDSANVRDAVRVLVASDTASEEFYNAHTESGTSTSANTTGSTVLAASITDSTLVHLRVYIYLDGEDGTIYTNNFNNLKTATISLSFVAEDT